MVTDVLSPMSPNLFHKGSGQSLPTNYELLIGPEQVVYLRLSTIQQASSMQDRTQLGFKVCFSS